MRDSDSRGRWCKSSHPDQSSYTRLSRASIVYRVHRLVVGFRVANAEAAGSIPAGRTKELIEPVAKWYCTGLQNLDAASSILPRFSTRAWYIGCASAFQADEASSILAARTTHSIVGSLSLVR